MQSTDLTGIAENAVALLGVPWDENSSFLRGPAEAPPVIREAIQSHYPVSMKVGKFILATALLSIAATAQQRSATMVTVRDAAGTPVTKGQITGWAARLFGQPDAQDDHVAATTDAAGRAVLRLLPGRNYEAFAAITRAGKIEASAVVTLASGHATEVQLTAAREPEQIQVRGLDAWAGLGPLKLSVSPTQTGWRFFDVPIDGTLQELPPPRRIRVSSALGQPLWESSWWPTGNKMPAPQPLSMRAVDTTGKAIVGVELWQRFPPKTEVLRRLCFPASQPQWRLLGVTDENGEATAPVAVDTKPGFGRTPITVEARAAGFSRVRGGIDVDGSLFRNHRSIAVPRDHMLPLVLEPDQELRMSAGTATRVSVIGKVYGNLLARIEGSLLVDVDASGTGRLPLPINERAMRVACFDRDDGARVIGILHETKAGSRMHVGGRRAHISVVDKHGLPAFTAQVWALAIRRHGSSMAVPIPLDGRASTKLELDGNPWCLRVRNGNQIAWHLFEDVATATIKLVLKDIPCMTISLVDEDGKLIAPQRLGVGRRSMSRGNMSREDRLLATFEHDLRSQNVVRGLPVAQNPLRLITLPLASRQAFANFMIGSQSFDVKLISGGETELIVRQ